MNETGATLAPLFSWRSAICESDLPPRSRHVAFTLSLYMGERGDHAWPGHARLTHDTGLANSTVREHLSQLVDAGWLVITQRGGGRGRANTYAASIPPSETCRVTDDPARETCREPEGSERETCRISTLNMPDFDPKHAGQPAPNSKDLSIELPTTGSQASKRTPSRRIDELFEALVAECYGTETITRSARGSVNRALADLRAVGADAAEIHRRARHYRRTWPAMTLTPTALAKHWAALAEPHRSSGSPGDQTAAAILAVIGEGA